MAEALLEFMSPIRSFFEYSVGWMTGILEKVTESPALLVLVLGFPIVGFAFGLLRRIISM